MAPWICRELFSKRSDVGRLFRRLATVRQREVLSPIFVSLGSRMHQNRLARSSLHPADQIFLQFGRRLLCPPKLLFCLSAPGQH